MKKIKQLISISPDSLKRKFILLFIFINFIVFLEIVSIGSTLPVIGILSDSEFTNSNKYIKNF